MGFLPDDVVLDQESPTPSPVPTPMRGRFLPDDVELDPVVPSLFSDPIGALTSSDWWLTRPSGERISAEQAVVGPASAALDALTAGHGDEITAGGNALIDALIGGPGYDSRLAEIRGIQNETPLAAQLLTGLAAAKLPIGSSIGAKDGLIKTGAKLAAEGAAYGGAYGFGEGEGSAADRITTAADTAKIGAALGPAIGLPIAAASKTVGALARKAPEWADKAYARAVGAKPGDFMRSAKSTAPRANEMGQMETALNRAIRDLKKENVFKGAMEPRDVLRQHVEKESQIAGELYRLLERADVKRGKTRLSPTYQRAMKFIDEAAPDEREVLRKRLAEWRQSMKSEGDGSLLFAQKAKEALYRREYPEGSRAVESLDKAIASDLRDFIERTTAALTPQAKGAVRQINRRLSAFEQTGAIIRRELGRDLGTSFFDKVLQFSRTSGGFGVPTLAGAYIGGIPGAALGAASGLAMRQASTPAGMAAIGRGLERMRGVNSPMPTRVAPVLAALQSQAEGVR